MNEDIARKKYNIAKAAYESMNSQEEIRQAAKEILLANPNVTLQEWGQMMAERFGFELIIAYGKDPKVIHQELSALYDEYKR